MSDSLRSPTSPVFPGRAPALVTLDHGSSLSVARFTPEISRGGHYVARMDPEDAYVVLFQLREHPPHDIRLDGRIQRTMPADRNSLHILDLASEPCGWLEQPVDTLMFHLPRSAIHGIAADAGAVWDGMLRPHVAWATPDPVVTRLHPLLLDRFAAPAPANQLLHDHLMRALGAHFMHTYGGLRPRRRVFRGGLAPGQERRAKELLSADLDRMVSIARVASECGLSPDHFSRAFKTSVGVAPHAWLLQRRIDRAKALLRSSHAPLAETASACGFADQSHLSRVFARHVGCTPGAWRRMQARG